MRISRTMVAPISTMNTVAVSLESIDSASVNTVFTLMQPLSSSPAAAASCR